MPPHPGKLKDPALAARKPGATLRTSRPIHLTIPADVADAQPYHLIVLRWGDSGCIS